METRGLYLNENRNMTIRRDGPSLWIKEKDKAGSRVPVRLIGQVVISGNVRLETDVITLLAENGIPLTFINRKSDSIATVMNVNETFSSIQGRIRKLLESENGAASVAQLINAVRHNLQMELLSDYFPQDAAWAETIGIRDSDYERIIRSILTSLTETRRVKIVSGMLDGLFHELVLKRVTELDLDPHTGFVQRHGNFAFVKDICRGMGPEKDRQAIQFFRGRKSEDLFEKNANGGQLTGEGMKNVVVRFENRKKKVLTLVDAILDEFFGIMRGVWR